MHPLTQPSRGFVSPLSVEAGIFSLLREYINHYSLYGAIFYFTSNYISVIARWPMMDICSVSLLSTFT